MLLPCLSLSSDSKLEDRGHGLLFSVSRLLHPGPSLVHPSIPYTLLNGKEPSWQHSHSIAYTDWPTGLPALPHKASLGLGWFCSRRQSSLFNCPRNFIFLDSDFPIFQSCKFQWPTYKSSSLHYPFTLMAYFQNQPLKSRIKGLPNSFFSSLLRFLPYI